MSEHLPLSDELARDLQARLEEHHAAPESSESWETVDQKIFGDAPDPDIEEVWSIEADRRWREIESGEVETIPWEEMRWRNQR